LALDEYTREEDFNKMLNVYANTSRETSINANRAMTASSAGKKKNSISEVKQKLRDKVKSRIPNILEGKRKNNRNANVVKLGESVEETKQASNQDEEFVVKSFY